MDPSRIPPKDVKSKLDRGEQVIFIDTRNAKAWDEADRKLPGAIRIPAGEIALHTHRLPRQASIVTYSTGSDEASSALAAEKLTDLGFENVAALEGGYEQWEQQRYPTEPK